MKSTDSIEYYEHHSSRLQGIRHLIKDLGEILPFLQELKSRSRILDLGCGLGVDLKRMAEAGHQVTGLDGSRKMVEMAQSLNPGIEVRLKNLLFLDLSPGEFEAIWINDVFNHFVPEMVQRVMAICFKGLVSGGVLGFVIKEGQGAYEDRSGDLNGPSCKIYLYGEKQLCSMVEQTGFKVEKIGRMKKEGEEDRMLILARRVG